MPTGLNTGDSAWVLVSTAMVLLMTPGLAFFYGGMVRAKNVLTMLFMSFVSISLVTILWFAFGYGIVFGPDVGGLGLIGWGDLRFADITPSMLHGQVPTYAFALFQLTFAIITVALISGSVAGRVRLGPWILFSIVWVILVYFPVAHWVFDTGGWINKWGVLDFAGGLVVELNSGMSGLALAIALGPGIRFRRKEPPQPSNIPFVMLGLALLWFGWFGFNGGSAMADGRVAVNAFLSTMIAGAAGMLTWLVMEWLRARSFTRLGSATGALAGLVAITPSCAYVNPEGALVIGILAAVVVSFAVEWKLVLGYDDTLDVVGVHGAAGIVGTLLIGLFATGMTGSTTKGLFYGGSIALLGKQLVAIIAVGVYVFVVTWVIGKVVDGLVRMKETEAEQLAGSDTQLRGDE
ncbi:ammonium transporter [Spongiactinospora sp. TRM90649]|uniref:ammonium transporter n=1 Tax=Spongiactinospora sp. TRM90649 TaxID=3031114 RepID=UPI0023FA25DC|nr:ammonium transporter [Spongiactinospora sp. TRM90649]MDF5752833.1 ammonium transporter [Spongiactinospora sp. TRM90649]